MTRLRKEKDRKRKSRSAHGGRERERDIYKRTKRARTTASREPTLISRGRDKRNEQVTSNSTLTSLFLFIGASKGLITSTTPLSPGRPCTLLRGKGPPSDPGLTLAPFQPSCPCLCSPFSVSNAASPLSPLESRFPLSSPAV